MHVRPWRIDDIPGLVRLDERDGAADAVPPGRLLTEHAPAERDAGNVFVRLVAESGGEVVGTAVARDHPFGRRGWLDVRVLVDEAHRRRGIGTALANALDEHLGAYPPAGLVARVEASDRASRAWAERRGFAHTVQEVRCVLDPRRAPVTPGITPNGVELFSLTDLDAAGARRLAEMVARLLAETPETGAVPGPRAATAASAFEHWMPVAPDASWIAASGDRWIGVTIAGRQGDGGLYTWFTGVDPDWRGAGIASALKRWAVASARVAGIERMVSEVAMTNTAMLAVNQALGATLEKPVWIVHRRRRRP